MGQFLFLQGWPNKAVNVDIFSGEKKSLLCNLKTSEGNESLKKKNKSVWNALMGLHELKKAIQMVRDMNLDEPNSASEF